MVFMMGPKINKIVYCLHFVNFDGSSIHIKGAHESLKIDLRIEFFHENMLGNDI